MVKQQPALKKKRLRSKQQLKRKSERLGLWGEQQAARYLTERGYTILDTNVYFPPHELDIVAYDKHSQEVVFVEVKTRSSTFFGNPAQAVGAKKRAALQRAAQKFLAQTHYTACRFDIVVVLPGTIEQYQNITW